MSILTKEILLFVALLTGLFFATAVYQHHTIIKLEQKHLQQAENRQFQDYEE